jgi:hypothetical protein
VPSIAARKRNPQAHFKETIMELLNQANLFFAIIAPIVLIVAINFVLQRADKRRPLFDARTPHAEAPVKAETAAPSLEAANDAQHQRAA